MRKSVFCPHFVHAFLSGGHGGFEYIYGILLHRGCVVDVCLQRGLDGFVPQASLYRLGADAVFNEHCCVCVAQTMKCKVHTEVIMYDARCILERIRAAVLTVLFAHDHVGLWQTYRSEMLDRDKAVYGVSFFVFFFAFVNACIVFIVSETLRQLEGALFLQLPNERFSYQNITVR